MAVPSYNHRDPWFADFFIKVLEDSKVIYNTSDVAPSSKITPFIFPGTGTGGWESALTNTLSPGDSIVTFTYGQFSKLWVSQCVCIDLNYERGLHALDYTMRICR